MMRKGYRQAEIGKVFGIEAQRVSDCFKYYNVHFDKRGMYINDTYFDVINTEEKAYLLGFLVADGCCRLEKERIKLQNV